MLKLVFFWVPVNKCIKWQKLMDHNSIDYSSPTFLLNSVCSKFDIIPLFYKNNNDVVFTYIYLFFNLSLLYSHVSHDLSCNYSLTESETCY